MGKGDLVYIESPYAESESGSMEDNLEYARKCMADSIQRGEFPFASHLLYPQILDDMVSPERRLGMNAGEAWAVYADLRAVYVDMGQSRGMDWGVARAEKMGQRVEYRSLNEEKTNGE